MSNQTKENLTHSDVFIGPFWADEPGCYIWCKNVYGNTQMCFTIFNDWGRKDVEERLKRAIALLNDEPAEPFKCVGYNFDKDLIGFGDNEEEAGDPILLTRGWGYLTGCGALHLDSKQAREIQLEFMKWVMGKLKGKTIEFENMEEPE